MFNDRNRWRRVVAGKISRMSADQARAVIATIEAERKAACPTGGATIFLPTIRALTGGLNSQAINGHVLRRLGVRAGIIRNAR